MFWTGRSQAVRLPKAFRAVRYLLDTSTVSFHIRRSSDSLKRRLRRTTAAEVGLSDQQRSPAALAEASA